MDGAAVSVDVPMLHVLSPSVDSSASSATTDSMTGTVASTPFCAFLDTSDLLSHALTFLALTDLLTTSAISRLIHSVVDSDKVWRPRLTAALAVSALPASEPPSSPPAPASSSTSAASPSILTVLSVIDAYSMSGGGHDNYRHRPSPLATTAVTAIVPTQQPLVYHVKVCSERSPVQCFVDYREMEIGPVQSSEMKEEADGHDGESGGGLGWEVKRVGLRFSGRLVLNAADNRHLLTAPSPPPARPQSAKQRYLSTYGCSVRHSAGSATSAVCHTLLPPQPPLPSPTVPPRWFSENLRDAVAMGVEPPPVPTSPFAPLVVWPVCYACRTEVAAAVQSVCNEWRRLRRERPLQVDCVIRINETEWDTRMREFEDEIEYRRVALTTATQPPAATAAASTASQSATPHKLHFIASRLYQYDSGQYAISHPSNLPFTNPAPPSGPPRIHPHHEHPLRYYRISPYRFASYVCNECAGNAHGDVWHCEQCQFDLCMGCATEWPVPAGEEGKEGEQGREGQQQEAEDSRFGMDGVVDETDEDEYREEREEGEEAYADGLVDDDEGDDETTAQATASF